MALLQSASFLMKWDESVHFAVYAEMNKMYFFAIVETSHCNNKIDPTPYLQVLYLYIYHACFISEDVAYHSGLL